MVKIVLYIKRMNRVGCYWCCLSWARYCRHIECSSIVHQIWIGSIDV